MTDFAHYFSQNDKLRVIIRAGAPWFVLADVCKVLEISNSRDASSRLDDDEKGIVITDTLGGPQKTTVISESGLYSLIMTSRKPEAKVFKRWVTGDVIPAIRKTGSYGAPAAAPSLEDAKTLHALLIAHNAQPIATQET